MDQAQADDAKLVVFRGRQGLFCGGLNLKIMPGLSQEQLLELVTQFGQTMCRVFLLDIPTVAAIEGHTIAGGMQLALACDRRFVMGRRHPPANERDAHRHDSAFVDVQHLQ